jgi:hypothetical protein
MLLLKNVLQILIALHVPIQIIVQMLKYDNNMLPELKTV